jgi:hypothetical protein
MNDDFIDTINNDLEVTANWRREKATEYPQDRRNDAAADTLDHLAEAIRVDPQSAGIVSLRKLEDELALRGRTDKNFDLSGLIVQGSDYRRRIGFSEFPTTAAQYLTTLAAMYRAHLDRARERGLILSADEIRQLRTTAADLRSKVSSGIVWKFGVTTVLEAYPISRADSEDFKSRIGHAGRARRWLLYVRFARGSAAEAGQFS